MVLVVGNVEVFNVGIIVVLVGVKVEGEVEFIVVLLLLLLLLLLLDVVVEEEFWFPHLVEDDDDWLELEFNEVFEFDILRIGVSLVGGVLLILLSSISLLLLLLSSFLYLGTPPIAIVRFCLNKR